MERRMATVGGIPADTGARIRYTGPCSEVRAAKRQVSQP